MTHYSKALILTLALAMSMSAAFAADSVTVLVNQKPYDVAEVSPSILDDEVMVPARLIAESTGAQVSYDAKTGTLTITCDKGTGKLKRGSKVAWIGGKKVFFPNAPYLYNNQFYAPMFFFNEMFDQAWYWDPFYQQFRWIPIFPRFRGQTRPPMFIPGPGRSPDYTPPTHPRRSSASAGDLVRPLPWTTGPKIVLRIDGKAETLQVAPNAVILRGNAGGQMSKVALSEIRPGDRVTFQRNAQGLISTIRATYKQVSGQITAINGAQVTLEGGIRFSIGPQTRVFLPDNTVGEIQDLVVGDVVAVSINPDTGETYVMQVQPRIAAEPVPGDRSNPIAVNTWGPLNTGDVLLVRFTGSPGGEAWFTVPGAAANVAMTEVSPGVYEGSYVVQQGDTALRQPIKVTFVAADKSTYTRLSSRPVTIRSLGAYRPRIISPRQGQQIDSPVVVRGMAEPGARVRVLVEFRRVVQGVLPLQGVTAVQDVIADAAGNWQTPPLAAVAPFSDYEPNLRSDLGIFSDLYTWDDRERPTVYTITAVSIGPSGEETAAYSVDVTKQPGYNVGGLMGIPVEQEAGSSG